MMTKFILMDIEGTTTSIDFVHQVLFPYASKHLETFVEANLENAQVQEVLTEVKATVQEEESRSLNDAEAIKQLLSWIEQDRKHGALKRLQGYMWKDGYKQGHFKGHLYEDVLPQMQAWKDQGVQLGIYSSGSVEAQKLLFGYSERGDLTPLLSNYFDTRIGHKREVPSYENIQKTLRTPPEQILFLSDVEAELDAAKSAGFQTIQLVRPGTKASEKHQTVKSFDEIIIPA